MYVRLALYRIMNFSRMISSHIIRHSMMSSANLVPVALGSVDYPKLQILSRTMCGPGLI